MSGPTYPASAVVDATMRTLVSHYNNLRKDALYGGADSTTAKALFSALARYADGVVLSYLATDRLRVAYDALRPPTLMIDGYMCQAAADVDLAASSFSGGAATWYVFANRSGTTFTLGVNTSATEAAGQRRIGQLYYDGTNVAQATIQTIVGVPMVDVATIPLTLLLTGVLSPSSIGADQNDYSPTNLSLASSLRLSSSAAYNITGLAGGADGRVLLIHNVGSFSITLKDESASSTAANRFALSGDVTIGADQSVILQYDSTSSRWRVAASPGAAALVGEIKLYAGSLLPIGYLWCDGSAVSRTTYSALFAAISTAFGVGDGTTTFNLPDLRGRVPVGKDNMGGSAANRMTTGGSGVDGATLGASGGAETHTLVTNETPAHDHTVYGKTGGAGVEVEYLTSNGTGTLKAQISTSSGGGAAHNNTQPTIMLNYIIKL